MKKQTFGQVFAKTCSVCALAALVSCVSASAPGGKKPAPAPDSPVIDSAPPIHVPDPASAPPMIYNYDEPSLIDIPSLDLPLSPLPVPSGELGDMLPNLVGSESVLSGYDPAALTELRKKIRGTLFFEDREHYIWRDQPKNSGPRRILNGVQPAADPAGRRLLYIDWTMKSVTLFVYDISNSTKKAVYTTADLVSQPLFSPDGKSVSFILISVSSGGQSLYKVDLASGAVTPLAKNLRFHNYAWNPADKSVWITVRDCPEESDRGSFCYARIDPGTGRLEYKTLHLKDAATGYSASLDVFTKLFIVFSKSGRLLAYDENGDSDYFFVADLNAMTVEKRAYKQPNGETINPRGMRWGPDGESLSMNFKGFVWIKTPDAGQPFPAITGFFVDSPASWTP